MFTNTDNYQLGVQVRIDPGAKAKLKELEQLWGVKAGYLVSNLPALLRALDQLADSLSDVNDLLQQYVKEGQTNG